MTTVLCFGTFDGLHPGHDDFFRQARTHGDRLIVVVALDRTVLEVKGQLPGMSETERVRRVGEHSQVHEARLGHPDDKYRVIEEIQPQVIVLGYDQRGFADGLSEQLQTRGLSPRIVRAESFHPEVYKSSLLRQMMPEIVEDDDDEDVTPL